MKILSNFPYSPFGRSAGSTQRFLQIILGLRELGHEIRLWSFRNPSGYAWDSADLESAAHHGVEVVLTDKGVFEPSLLDEVDFVWCCYFHYLRYYDGFTGPKVIETADLLTCNFQIDEYFANHLSKEGDIFIFDREIFEKEPIHTEFPIREEELSTYREVHPIMISLREQERLAQKAIKSTYIPYLPKLPEITSDYSGLPLSLCSAHLNNLYANDLLGIKLLPKMRLKAPIEINCLGELNTICRHFPFINYLGYQEDDWALRTAKFGLWGSPYGTGRPLKLLTYMSYGLPTVLFKSRLELPLQSGINCLAADTYEEFCEYCIMLLRDKDRCKKLGKEARESIKNYYTKEKLLNDLNNVINLYL